MAIPKSFQKPCREMKIWKILHFIFRKIGIIGLVKMLRLQIAFIDGDGLLLYVKAIKEQNVKCKHFLSTM